MRNFLIQSGLVALLLLSVYISGKIIIRLKGEKSRLENNLIVTSYELETASGKLAYKTEAYSVTLKELRQVKRQKDSLNNDYERKLKYAYDKIKDLNIKLNNAQSVNTTTIQASGGDTMKYIITKVDSVFYCELPPFNDGYLKADFNTFSGSYIDFTYLYRDTVDIVVSREKGLRDNGKKRFFIARWFKPDWQYFSNVTLGNPEAEIISNTYIQLK